MKQADIIAAVKAGRAVYEWVPLDVGRVRVWVMADALKIDDVRVPVTAATEQEIADLLGGMLLTPKLVDLIYQVARWRPDPHLLKPTSGWDHVVRRSRSIDLAHPEAQPTDLIAPVGKDWVLTSSLTPKKAANYGLHHTRAPYAAATLPGVRVWQPIGHAHNAQHVDWSQLCRLARRRCLVDGREADLREVLSDPILAPLVSHEGVLRVVRQPGVPEPEAVEPETEPAPAQVITLPEITIYGVPPVLAPPKPAAPAPEAPVAALAGDESGISYIPARHYTRADRTQVLWVVIHTAECAEVRNAAENLAAWAAGPQAPKASWHYAVDSDSITQSVLERHVAWHAPGANGKGIGIEHAGRASQQPAQWDDEYSRSVLEHSAALVARICSRWSIPVRRIGVSDLLAGTPGICGHLDVSRAFKRSTHTDPGPGFPWDRFLAAALRDGP